MSDNNDLSFEEWAELAQNDPKKFFAERARVIDNYINKQPSDLQRVLRDLQNRIDATRATAGTPNQAVRELSRMMEDYLLALSERLMSLRRETSALQDTLQQGLRS